MPEEVRFFRRLSLYAIVIGIVYWFVSYEWMGTTLLLVFGLGAGAATLLLLSGASSAVPARSPTTLDVVARPGASSAPTGTERADVPLPDGPFGDESGRIPSSTSAPFLVGLAVALGALGLVFGPWFLLVALIPFSLGASAWFGASKAELDAVEREG